MTTAVFSYQNHAGNLEKRTVEVEEITWLDKMPAGYEGPPVYQPGWFLIGIDHNRDERRSFALSHVILPETRGGGYRLVDLRS